MAYIYMAMVPKTDKAENNVHIYTSPFNTLVYYRIMMNCFSTWTKEYKVKYTDIA
jgi:hypothetical protein